MITWGRKFGGDTGEDIIDRIIDLFFELKNGLVRIILLMEFYILYNSFPCKLLLELLLELELQLHPHKHMYQLPRPPVLSDGGFVSALLIITSIITCNQIYSKKKNINIIFSYRN